MGILLQQGEGRFGNAQTGCAHKDRQSLEVVLKRATRLVSTED
jgi:hypothetical protein